MVKPIHSYDKVKYKNATPSKPKYSQKTIATEVRLIHITHKYMNAHFSGLKTLTGLNWFYGPKPPVLVK